MEQPALLEMRGICKEFPGVKALDNVNLTVRPGTVHALMGENGAGKSTLMKCLFGIYHKDAGTITLDGKEVNFRSSKEALENGVAMVHQELNQALTRSVQDNLWLGRYPKVAGIMVSEGLMAKRTKEIFDALEVTVNPKAIMSTLPVSQRQMVEIAKAVSYDSKIIVFDEPTSSLTETEVEHLFRIINMLRDKGCGIIYISHKMEEILRISDDVTIMRDGTWVATRPAKELTMDEIIRLMVGRELTNRFPPKTNTPGEVILNVEHICGKYTRLKDATFQLRKGEILGIAGIEGNGQSELIEAITGMRPLRGGTVTIMGKSIAGKTPGEIRALGLAHVPEDRLATGVCAPADITDNLIVGKEKDPRFSWKRIHMKRKAIRAYAQEIFQRFDIRGAGVDTAVGSLSGGNMQKVVVAREFSFDTPVLIISQPTRGVDIGAMDFIHQQIMQKRNAGCAILLVSADLDELLRLSDRLLAIYEGRITGEFQAGDIDKREISYYMTGGRKEEQA